METLIALTALSLAPPAAAQFSAAIVPHVEEGGRVSWTAIIDVATVKTFEESVSGTPHEGQPTQALGRWLDAHLASVSWCKQGWRYRAENPHYIEELDDGRLRVLGMCHAARR